MLNELFSAFTASATSAALAADLLANLTDKLHDVAVKATAERDRVGKILDGLPSLPACDANSPLAQTLGLTEAMTELKTARDQLEAHREVLGHLATTAVTQAEQVREAKRELTSVATVQPEAERAATPSEQGSMGVAATSPAPIPVETAAPGRTERNGTHAVGAGTGSRRKRGRSG